MRKLILATACLALVVSWAGAVDTLAVHQDSLANGLKVLTVEKHDLPVVSFQIWYRVGSRNERPGITGISHLLEHMMFKSTDRIGPEEFSRIVQKYGGHCNAFTSEDYTAYFENMATEFLPIAMELESDRMQNLKLEPAEFDPERNVVKEERRLRENSPYGRLFEELYAAAYIAHPYSWPVLGWMSDIEAMTVQDLREYYRTYYAPNNATCVMVGDITRKDAMELVTRYFKNIPRNPKMPPKVTTVEPPQMGERRIKVNKDTKTPLVAIGYHTVEMGNKDFYTLEIISNILSNGESSRLYRSLVYDEQIALFVGGFNESQTNPTIFVFYSAPLKGHNTNQLEQAIENELEKVKTEGVTPRELEKAKNQLEAKFVFQQQRASGLAIQIGAAETRRSWRFLNDYLKKIRSVTNNDIISVANKYFIVRKQNRSHPYKHGVRSKQRRCKMKKTAFSIILLLLVTACLSAQTIWAPPKPERFTLKNGLTVLLLEKHQLPVISIDIMIKAGSITDPSTLAGLANFTSGMLSKGTLTRNALEIAESFDFVGAQFSAQCDYDAVFLSLTALPKDFEGVAAVLFDLLTKPKFDSLEIQRLRSELISTIETNQDHPNTQSSEAFNQMLYGDHPYAHPEMGFVQSVGKIRPADIATHYRNYYQPNNCIISIVGDFKSAKIKKLINKQLGTWPRRPVLKATIPKIPEIKGSRALMINRQLNQAYINLGFLGPKRNEPDYQAIRVMNYILGGGGFVSRLVKSIRMVQGLAYDVGSSYDPRLDNGPYYLYVQTKCASADTAVKSLILEMRRMQTELVADEELKEAKDYIRGSYPFRFETNSQTARQVLYLELYDLGADYFKKDIEKTLQVSKADVMAAAKKYLKPDNFLLAVATDTSQTKLNIPGLKIDKQ